jgi:alpha/beta superfamily hydrolase
VRQSAVLFKAKGLNFEGVVATPDDTDGPFPGVVMCHPHPLFGGSMDNNVVLSVTYALAQHGFATIRFNFRGVGNSEGQHTKGELEYQEVLGAMELLKAWKGVDGNNLGLAGYSFGTSVILGSAAAQKKPKAFAFISPPLRALESTPLKKDKRPKLIISGDRDKLVQSDQLQSVLESFSHPPTLKVIEGADHFWGGKEDLLVKQVSQFFVENLK